MNPKDRQPKPKPDPDRSVSVQTSSPRYPLPPKKSSSSSADASATANSHRKIAIAVDLSDESAFAVQWAVNNYLRPSDAVTILHIRPTTILYGADWGSTHFSDAGSAAELSRERIEEDFDSFTASKVAELARPLEEARVSFKVQIVKDHDMKERLCLEIERLGVSAVIMGSRGFGASRRSVKSRLGSVSDYCVRHCVCPVVVVRYHDDKEAVDGDRAVPEEEQHDHKD